jgi:5-methylcytosine-specific restriction enzyme A
MKKPFKPCNKIGCNNLTRDRYCVVHIDEQQKKERQYDREVRNQEHVKFYNSKEWKSVRLQALMRDNYLCVKCRANGKLTSVMNKKGVVDHIVELQDNWGLRITLSNLQTLCHACHNVKTEEERKKRRGK